MKPKTYTPLALMAADEEDLEVVSAVLQDAVAKTGEMAFLPRARRFVLVANRFVWEEGVRKSRGPFARVRTGAHFDDVVRVRSKNVDLSSKDAVVSILAVRFDAAEDGTGTIVLNLAGGGAIALDVEAINLTLEDLSDPWATRNRPNHEEAQ